VVAAFRIWCLVFKLLVWCGAEGCVSGLWAAAASKPDTQTSIDILFKHIIEKKKKKKKKKEFMYSYNFLQGACVAQSV
jgi:hypothetical protein